MFYQSATTINTGTLPADAQQLLRSWRAQTTDPIPDA
jgi:hypothetical protein